MAANYDMYSSFMSPTQRNPTAKPTDPQTFDWNSYSQGSQGMFGGASDGSMQNATNQSLASSGGAASGGSGSSGSSGSSFATAADSWGGANPGTQKTGSGGMFGSSSVPGSPTNPAPSGGPDYQSTRSNMPQATAPTAPAPDPTKDALGYYQQWLPNLSQDQLNQYWSGAGKGARLDDWYNSTYAGNTPPGSGSTGNTGSTGNAGNTTPPASTTPPTGQSLTEKWRQWIPNITDEDVKNYLADAQATGGEDVVDWYNATHAAGVPQPIQSAVNRAGYDTYHYTKDASGNLVEKTRTPVADTPQQSNDAADAYYTPIYGPDWRNKLGLNPPPPQQGGGQTPGAPGSSGGGGGGGVSSNAIGTQPGNPATSIGNPAGAGPQPAPPVTAAPPGTPPPAANTATPAPAPTAPGAAPSSPFGAPNAPAAMSLDDLSKYYRQALNPEFQQEQEDTVRSMNAADAATGDINAGGRGLRAGKEISRLVSNQGQRVSDAVVNTAQQQQQLGSNQYIAQLQAALQNKQIDTNKALAELTDDTTRLGIHTNDDLQRYLNGQNNALAKYGIDTNDVLTRYKANLELEGQKYSADKGFDAAKFNAAASQAAAARNSASQLEIARLNQSTQKESNQQQYDLGVLGINAANYRSDQQSLIAYLQTLLNAGMTPTVPPGGGVVGHQ